MIQHPIQRLMTLQARDLLSFNGDAVGDLQHEANSANLSKHKKRPNVAGMAPWGKKKKVYIIYM